MKKILIAALCSTLLLSGCAKSPQQVSLTPQIKVNQYINNQPTVYLSIIDARPSKVIGSRGGVYRDTNTITLNPDLVTSLKPAATRALNDMGVVVDQPSPKPVELTLKVEELSYQVADNSTLPLEITLRAQVSVAAKEAGRVQAFRYESKKVHKFFTPPNDSKNQQVINEILSETLNRLFNDPKLVELIKP